MNKRTALITGASAGIGKEFAYQLGAKGYDLVLTARREERLRALAKETSGKYGVVCHVLPADLARPEACKELHQAVQDKGIHVDFLVNNAGYGVAGTLTKPAWHYHEDFIRVMVTAVVELSYLFLPAMQEKGWGRIINVASLAGLVPSSAGHTLYGASKGFMIKFSESLYFENRKLGVKVQALCPGFTHTEFHDVTGTRDMVMKMDDSWWQNVDEVVEYSLKKIETEKSLPIAVSGAKNRRIAAITRWLPKRWIYEYMDKRLDRFRLLDE